MRKALIAVLILVVVLLALDRIGVVVAESQIASRVQSSQGLARKPSVSIRGFPFLTQVLTGRYDQLDVTVHDFAQQGLTVDVLTVHAHGVSVPLSKVISGSVSEVPVDRTDARVTISYQHLNDYLKQRLDGQVITVSGRDDGTLTLTGTLPFPPRVSLSVSALVQVGSSSITLQPTSLDSALSQIPGGDAARSLVQQFFTVRLPISQLPFGIALKSATVKASGVVIDASATGLTLRNPSG
jgi:hypothetical protein